MSDDGHTYGVNSHPKGMLMPDLSRSQFCDLTRLSPDTLKSLSRREQLPFSIDQKASGRGYTLFEAFLTIVAQEFSEGHGVNITRAAEIAGALPEVLAPQWDRIIETGRILADGTGEKVEEVMCGRYDVAGIHPPRPLVGTDEEIARELAASDQPPIRSVRSSASRSLALLLIRASKLNIEIPDEFWKPPFNYRQRPDGRELSRASMQKLIEQGAHLEETED
ncbi:HTH merR-type domain-containing protein [Methylorubrum populi]